MRLISILFSLVILLTTQHVCKGQKAETDYSISYFGNNLWNEGLNFGIEKPRSETIKTKKNGKTRTIIKTKAYNLGFYNDHDSHLGMFFTAGWAKKKVFGNRFNFTTAAQPMGLYRSFLPETYKVKDNGDIKKLFLPGRFYLAPSVSAGIGRMGKWNPDNGWYTRINITTLFPYSRAIVSLINVEFGYHFKINKTDK